MGQKSTLQKFSDVKNTTINQMDRSIYAIYLQL